jgi:ubiquinone/menaquinone biosynthesis C-methylase UbiE
MPLTEWTDDDIQPGTCTYEADVVAGLTTIAANEIARIPGVMTLQPGYPRDDIVRFSYSGGMKRLLGLRSAQAVYRLLELPIPRPKALLGHQNLRLLHEIISSVVSLHSPGAFRTLGIAAAGSDSGVMRRLCQEAAKTAGLLPAESKGDLMLRIRPSLHKQGWDVLVRLSPRPLATRDWRIHNYEAALNATVAYAMIGLTSPQPEDVYVNLCCGTGTLLVERLRSMRARAAIGVDQSLKLVTAATAHLQAAHMRSGFVVCQGDATRLPLPDSCVTSITADLPFGQNTGSHDENQGLYPAILAEAARIARHGTRFALLTHEIRLMERLLPHPQWTVKECLRITLRGLHPRIYLLERL